MFFSEGRFFFSLCYNCLHLCFIRGADMGSGLLQQCLQGDLPMKVPSQALLAGACSCVFLFGLAWELRLLFDLVCFGLLIKHVLCFVGGASQSGAEWFTHPLYSFLFHRCAAGRSRARGTEKDTLEREGEKKYQPSDQRKKSFNPRVVSILHSKREPFTILHIHSI